MLKKLFFSFAVSLVATMGMAQNTSNAVRGRVVDSNGDPLVGVSIKVDGEQTGTITNADGEFTLANAKNKTLSVQYVGMQTLSVKGTSDRVLNLTMTEDNNLLNDVMVTGYQQLSRERVTGAFDKVSSDKLAAHPGSDISSALQGLVAGLQGTEKEDGSVEFQIRGISTLYGDKQPLIVVDGFPIEGNFSSINPNDVESVTVLKDAAAASIWGARSANGVIVITTKNGGHKKLSVDFQAMVRVGFNPDIDYILNQADSRTYVDYEKMAWNNNWGIWPYEPGFYNNYGKGLSLAQDLLAEHDYYNLSESDMNARLEQLANTSNRQQLKDNLMHTPLLQQYNLNISGGNERMSNYLSVMYEGNKEATIKRGYERFMANYNTSYKFNKYITGTFAATWQKRSNDNTGVTVRDFGSLSPYELLLNPDGSYARQAMSFNKFEVEALDKSKFLYDNFDYNMLQEVNNRKYKTNENKMRIQLGVNAKIFKGLSYDIKYQFENNLSDYRNIDGEETFAVREMMLLHTDYDGSLNYANGTYLPKGARLKTGNTHNYNQVFRNQLSYSNTFGKNDISVIAGIEMSEYVNKVQTDATVWGYDERSNTATAPYYGAMDIPLTMFGYQYVDASELGLAARYMERTDRYLSYYGNLGYMFDEKYGASFSVRSDGSNFVTKDKSLRWSPMWSAGLKWNIANESFLKGNNAVNYLTLRATYGVNGNAEKSTSPQTLLSISSSSATHVNQAVISSYGNPLLRWEKTYTTNVGLDFAFFNNILTGKIDYYNRLSKDIVGDVSTSSFLGTQTARFNNAQILNRGIEVELGAHHTFKSIGLGVNSTATFSYNQNKIQKLFFPNIYCFEMVEGRFVENAPLGSVFAYKYAGLNEDGYPSVYGKEGALVPFKDLNLHNNEVGTDVMQLMGSTISPYAFGWSTELTWKGISLNVLFTGKFGGVFRSPAPTIPSVGSSKVTLTKQLAEMMKSDGTESPCMPKAGDSNNYKWNRYLENLDIYVEKSDYIRLKELSLGYTLPSNITRSVNLSAVKFFVQMRDLGLIYAANKLGYDPEWLPGTNKPAGSVTFGANIKF